MEQHLATEHDGEPGEKPEIAEEKPDGSAGASPETLQNTSPAAETEQSVSVAPEEIDPTFAAEAVNATSDSEPHQPVGIEPTTVDAEPQQIANPVPSEPTIEAAAHSTIETAPVVSEEDSEPAVDAAPAEPAAAQPAPVAAPAQPKPVENHVPAPPPQPSPAFLEQWQQNETMRHIPELAWIIAKVDGDIRKRLELFLSIFETVASADPRHRAAEESLFAICRSLDRLAEAARRTRSVLHPPNEIVYRIPWSVNTAVSVLRNSDSSTFGRRQPFQSFERSAAESVYGAVCVVLQRIDAAAALLREIDTTIDEKLFGPLVKLEQPLPTTPIA